jgi:hypothetical protein
MKATACRPLLLLAILSGSACAMSHEPRLVSFPLNGARPAAHIDAVDNYRTAVATIMRAVERDLGIAPFPFTVRLYPNREAFESALVGVGHDPAFARTTARTMIAVGGHRGVLLNEGSLALRPWPDRTLLLAHEIAHSIQYELGGGMRGTSDQWLREGFADWFSARVLERLDGLTMTDFRRQKHVELRSVGRANLPRLAEMVTFRQWVELGQRRGPAAYAVGFLGVELLIERHGVQAVLDYFARFATAHDRRGNFRAAFDEDLETFEQALAARIWPR